MRVECCNIYTDVNERGKTEGYAIQGKFITWKTSHESQDIGFTRKIKRGIPSSGNEFSYTVYDPLINFHAHTLYNAIQNTANQNTGRSHHAQHATHIDCVGHSIFYGMASSCYTMEYRTCSLCFLSKHTSLSRKYKWLHGIPLESVIKLVYITRIRTEGIKQYPLDDSYRRWIFTKGERTN